uniref:CCDC92/74 N-terminal domain-containing protein n=1 Tax=Oryzias latipes TaxID=8090 RepID=A0A3B3HDK8_ORYLA
TRFIQMELGGRPGARVEPGTGSRSRQARPIRNVQTAPEETGHADRRVTSLERSIQFLQEQHKETLQKLHAEIDHLRRENKGVQSSRENTSIRILKHPGIDTKNVRSSSSSCDTCVTHLGAGFLGSAALSSLSGGLRVPLVLVLVLALERWASPEFQWVNLVGPFLRRSSGDPHFIWASSSWACSLLNLPQGGWLPGAWGGSPLGAFLARAWGPPQQNINTQSSTGVSSPLHK